MKVDQDVEPVVNYNKYDTGKNLREGQQQVMDEESIEKMGAVNSNNIKFDD
jgi:hypothetical protein